MLNYSESRSQFDTLDILLFSGSGLISDIIKFGSGSTWSHIGVVYKIPRIDELFCFESTTLSNIPDFTTGTKVKGVQLVPLSQRLATYEGDAIAYRRIYGLRSLNMLKRIGVFRREFSGRPYEQNQLELMHAALDFLPFQKNQPDASSVFCSELIALLLREVGVLEKTDKPANEFTPGDFAGELKLCDGYALDVVNTFLPFNL